MRIGMKVRVIYLALFLVCVNTRPILLFMCVFFISCAFRIARINDQRMEPAENLAPVPFTADLDHSRITNKLRESLIRRTLSDDAVDPNLERRSNRHFQDFLFVDYHRII